MNEPQRAALLNNEGVQLLQAERYASAIRLFRQALSVVHYGSERDTFQSVPCSPASTSSPSSSPSSPTVQCIPHNSTDQSCSKHRPGRSDGCDYFVYRRPFLIVAHAVPTRRHEYTAALDLVGSHVLFNLAVAWHGRAKGSGRDKDVMRAAQHYGVLLQLVTRLMRQSHNVAAYERLRLLVFNNLADLHYEQCQYKKVASCLDLMVEMLSPSGNENGSRLLLEKSIHPDDLSDLFWNVLHVKPPTLAPAA